jgi:cell division protein FtsL
MEAANVRSTYMGRGGIATPAPRARGTRAAPSSRRGLSFWHILILLVSLTLGALLNVQGRNAVYHERYLLQKALQERHKLQMENRRLRLIWATITSTERLERMAKGRFRLHHPLPHEVVRIK